MAGGSAFNNKVLLFGSILVIPVFFIVATGGGGLISGGGKNYHSMDMDGVSKALSSGGGGGSSPAASGRYAMRGKGKALWVGNGGGGGVGNEPAAPAAVAPEIDKEEREQILRHGREELARGKVALLKERLNPSISSGKTKSLLERMGGGHRQERRQQHQPAAIHSQEGEKIEPLKSIEKAENHQDVAEDKNNDKEAKVGKQEINGDDHQENKKNAVVVSESSSTTQQLKKKFLPKPGKCTGLRCSWTHFLYTDEDVCEAQWKMTKEELQELPSWRSKIGPLPLPNRPRNHDKAPDPYTKEQREEMYSKRKSMLMESPEAKAFIEKYVLNQKFDLEGAKDVAESFVMKVALSVLLGRLQPDAEDLVPAIVTPLLCDGPNLASLLHTFEPVPVMNFVFVWNSNNDVVARILKPLQSFPFGVHVIHNGKNVGFSASINMGMLKAIEMQGQEGSKVFGAHTDTVILDVDETAEKQEAAYNLALEEVKSIKPAVSDEDLKAAGVSCPVAREFYKSIDSSIKEKFPFEPLWFFLVNADTQPVQGTMSRLGFYANKYSPQGYGIFYLHEQEHYAFAVSLVAIRSAGLMDEAIFPAYMEDVDWHWRIRLCGLGQILTGGHIHHVRSVNLRFARCAEIGSFHQMHGRSGNHFAYGKAKWGYYAQHNIYDDRPPSGVSRPFNIARAPLSLWAVNEAHRKCFTHGQGLKNIEGHCWYNGENLLDYFTNQALRDIRTSTSSSEAANDGGGAVALAEQRHVNPDSLKKLLPSVVLDHKDNLNKPHHKKQTSFEDYTLGIKQTLIDRLGDQKSKVAEVFRENGVPPPS